VTIANLLRRFDVQDIEPDDVLDWLCYPPMDGRPLRLELTYRSKRIVDAP
jgi:hypothetical protein